MSGEPSVSSIRIIPGGIAFPLLPCSRESCSRPFLILPALTSQWHWALVSDKGPFVPRVREEMEEMQSRIEKSIPAASEALFPPSFKRQN